MMKQTIYALTFGLASIWVSQASANSVQTLKSKSKSDTILALGKAPIKKKKALNLGELRTREARLPNGILTLEDRMKLRVNQALKRQQAVTNASRKRKQHTNKSGGNQSEDGNNAESTEMR